MQTLRERNKGRRRAQILEAAHGLIGAHGVDGLTMRALSERAQLSVPTIYHLIGGRDAVLAALLASGGSRFDALMAGAPTAPVGRAVTAVGCLAQLVAENRAVVHAVLATGPHLLVGDPADTLLGRARHAVEGAFTDAARTSVIRRSTDPAAMAERLDALVAGAIVAWALRHDDDERLRIELEHGVLLLFTAVASPEARPAAERRLRRCERELHRLSGPTAASGATAQRSVAR